MTFLKDYLASLGPGIDIVADAQGLTGTQLHEAGAPDAVAYSLLQLCESFYGKCAFSAMQRDAVSAARRNGHSLPALEVIDRFARRAPNQREGWLLRLQLCRTKADVSVLEKMARKRLRALRKPPKIEEGVKIKRRKDQPWTLSITGSSALTADLYAAIPNLNAARRVLQGQAGSTVTTTNVIINLDELDKIIDGDGEEIQLRMTNGATISGADLVTRLLSEHGLVTLVHPYEGPVNLYRTRRLANEKQRLMAKAENPVCPGYKCRAPADECQVHHMEAWKQGGMTNMNNLTMACRFHNGFNDDNSSAPPKNGRFERRNGTVRWLPPWASR
ncbi:HNH endonuclease signature motif containing protein [Corynebacterium camporealensis]